ncbi:MAG TPA: PH domain-containing protein [Phycisphaerales bacterium]|nr:PH domain-containing protein [Phycisphaerales bacterium]
MSETCENCGKQIGDLETPHVFQGHIVCAECDKKLRTGGSPPEMPDASKEYSERKAPGEERVLYDGRPSMWRNRPVGFVLSLFLILVGGVGLVILAIWYLRVLGTRLTVTSERTTLRHGILSKHISEVLHRDVRYVELTQGALQRLLGVGTIEIASAGHAGVELAVSGIPHPDKVKQIIDEQRRCT